MNRTAVLGLFSAFVVSAQAQQQFPEGATTPAAAEIKKYVEDKVFNVKVSDGATWRMEYKGDGTLTVNSSAGGRTYFGTWSFEDGKLCDQPRGKVKSCNDVRISQDLLLLRRDNGEIIQFTP